MTSKTYLFGLILTILMVTGCNSESKFDNYLSKEKERKLEEIQELNQEVIESLKRQELKLMNFMNDNASIKEHWIINNPVPMDTSSIVIMNETFSSFSKTDYSLYGVNQSNYFSCISIYGSFHYTCVNNKESFTEEEYKHYMGYYRFFLNEYNLTYKELGKLVAEYDLLTEIQRIRKLDPEVL